MMRLLRSTLVVFSGLAVLTGVVYPVFMTGIGQLFFYEQANGSLLRMQDGKIRGSILISQSFQQENYFHGRPSPTADTSKALSGGRNLSPTNQILLQDIIHRAHSYRQEQHPPIPMDLLTASGSGLDPHITPAAARLQVTRISHARQISPENLMKLIEEHTVGRTFFILGEPRINVLEINLALDQLYPTSNR